MKIEITDLRKIYAIDKEFTAMFPNLKLLFFAKPHTAKGASPKRLAVSPSKTVGECRVIHTKGTLTITPHMTVSDLKRELNDTFGLTVGIYHKVSTEWVEVTTDMVTLEKQNAGVESPEAAKAL
jgi:hypothetical protein